MKIVGFPKLFPIVVLAEGEGREGDREGDRPPRDTKKIVSESRPKTRKKDGGD